MKKETKQIDINQKVKEYNNFINQIEIVNVYLISAKIDNLSHEEPSSGVEFGIRERSWYENRKNYIDCYHRYILTAKDDAEGQKVALVSITFVAVYQSEIPMSNEIFQTFKERNLPLNTWPYFREFVQSSFMRMGWTAVVVPVYNIIVSRSKAK